MQQTVVVARPQVTIHHTFLFWIVVTPNVGIHVLQDILKIILIKLVKLVI